MPVFSAFFVVLFSTYYFFGELGLNLFGGRLYPGNPALRGTDYESADLFALNFNSLADTFAVLFHLMVINDWYGFSKINIKINISFSVRLPLFLCLP